MGLVSFTIHQQQDDNYPPRRVREVLELLGDQQPAQDLALAVGERLL